MRRCLVALALAAGCRSTGEPIVRGDVVPADQALAAASWFGNSWPADDDRRAVQRTISDLFVVPDGTVYTYSAFKGGGYRAVIYKDRQRVGRMPYSTAAAGGNSITVDGAFVYVDDSLGANGPRVSRLDRDGNDLGFFFPLSATSEVRGLVATAGELFVADHATGEIVVFDAGTPAARPVRRWAVPRAGEMAIDAAGLLWVIQEKDPTAPARVVAFDRQTGAPVAGKVISDAGDPRDLAVDGQGRLWVADSGPDYQLRIYGNLSSAPALAATFGVKGGVFAGVPGEIAPGKLNQPNAVGIDQQGNVYVNSGMRGLGAQLEAYRPSGERLWELSAVGAVYDGAALDPGAETDVFGKAFHFRMDWTQPPGQEARLVGFTEGSWIHDRVAPVDARTGESPLSITRDVRRLRGRPFVLATASGGRGYLAFYRRDAGTEIAAPAVIFGKRGGGSWPPGQPSTAAPWIWRDANGDGRFDAGEFESAGLAGETGADWGVDESGDVWLSIGANPAQLVRWRLDGLDAAANPLYRAAARDTFVVPEPFTASGAEAIAYVPATDTLYLAGYTAAAPRRPEDSGYVGSTLARYDHFLDPARRRKAWETTLERGGPEGEPRTAVLAGRYVFIVHHSGAVVRVYDAETGGASVATLRPSAPVFSDRENGILSAARRKNGEYVVFVDEGFYRKIILYRWNPGAPASLAAVAGDGVTLTWAAPLEGPVTGYHVYRSSRSGADYRRITGAPVRATRYVDTGAPPGARSHYRVSAVTREGENAFSYEVPVDVQ